MQSVPQEESGRSLSTTCTDLQRQHNQRRLVVKNQDQDTTKTREYQDQDQDKTKTKTKTDQVKTKTNSAQDRDQKKLGFFAILHEL